MGHCFVTILFSWRELVLNCNWNTFEHLGSIIQNSFRVLLYRRISLSHSTLGTSQDTSRKERATGTGIYLRCTYDYWCNGQYSTVLYCYTHVWFSSLWFLHHIPPMPVDRIASQLWDNLHHFHVDCRVLLGLGYLLDMNKLYIYIYICHHHLFLEELQRFYKVTRRRRKRSWDYNRDLDLD